MDLIGPHPVLGTAPEIAFSYSGVPIHDGTLCSYTKEKGDREGNFRAVE